MGTELLLGEVIDTNSSHVAKIMSSLGIDVFRKTTVGDNLERVKTSLKESLARTDIALICGGLGPTEDDVTKIAVGELFQRKLILNNEVFEGIKQRFTHHPIPQDAIKRQSLVIEDAQIVPNPAGTAPGMILEKEGKTVLLLPGVPGELQAMLPQVSRYLSRKVGPGQLVIKSRTLKVFGLGESQVNEKIASLMSEKNPTVALLAKKGEVHIRITAKGKLNEVNRKIERVERIIREKIGDYIFTANEKNLEEVVGNLLISKNITVSVAESCSGGLIAHRLTGVPGISASLLCGVVSYSNQAKSDILGVPSHLIQEKGAVSAEVAKKMAREIRKLSGSDISVGTTGIAGPTGGTPEKPVGLVYIALSTNKKDICQRYQFPGTRDMVKWRTSQAALDVIRRNILGKLTHHGGKSHEDNTAR